MTRLNRLGVCALAAAWFSCANLEDDRAALGAEPPEGAGEGQVGGDPPAEGRLVLSIHGSGGERAPGDGFSSSDAVYLKTQLADERATVAEGDFAFVVVDADGKRASTDALDCRRFHVDKGGRLTELYMGLDIDGAQCRHGASATGAGYLVQLAPFSPDGGAAGAAAEYTVLVARVGDIVGTQFPDSAARATFAVSAPAQSACGDGGGDDDDEADDADCDDGSSLAR